MLVSQMKIEQEIEDSPQIVEFFLLGNAVVVVVKFVSITFFFNFNLDIII